MKEEKLWIRDRPVIAEVMLRLAVIGRHDIIMIVACDTNAKERLNEYSIVK